MPVAPLKPLTSPKREREFSMSNKIAPLGACLMFALCGPLYAQSGHDHTASMDHTAHMTAQKPTQAEVPTKSGQSAFGAIAEIVAILRSDPDTDWGRVNIDALRAHLVDMDAVTMRARVVSSKVAGGAAFDVTSPDADVVAAIRRMTLAHGKTMSETDRMQFRAEKTANGAHMVVTGPDGDMIRGLGFFGVMALGNHHQAHHIALAQGRSMGHSMGH